MAALVEEDLPMELIFGLVALAVAIVTSTVSARLFSQGQRGTPTSRLLLVIGLLFWIVAAYLLPPVALLSDLEVSAWVSVPLRVVAALVLGSTVSRIWYGIVP
jgi:hypothetical protein